MAALRGANSVQPRDPPSRPPRVSWRRLTGKVAKSDIKCKKVAKSFGGSNFFYTFAPMDKRKFIITGINKLTGNREQISGPMLEEEASQRLQREIANRRFQRYKTHTGLKIEPYDAVQLTFNFNEHEQQ